MQSLSHYLLPRAADCCWRRCWPLLPRTAPAAAAADAYRCAVKLNPRDYRAWYGLGQTYELLGMPVYALHYYRCDTCDERSTSAAGAHAVWCGVVWCGLVPVRASACLQRPRVCEVAPWHAGSVLHLSVPAAPPTASRPPPGAPPRRRAALLRPSDPRMWCALGHCYEAEGLRQVRDVCVTRAGVALVATWRWRWRATAAAIIRGRGRAPCMQTRSAHHPHACTAQQQTHTSADVRAHAGAAACVVPLSVPPRWAWRCAATGAQWRTATGKASASRAW